MVDYEFQNEDTGKEMVKKLLRIWSIKKGKENQSIVAITFCVFTSVVISLLVSYILRFEFISGLLLFIGEYATLTYVVLGVLGAYSCNRFRGHLLLRWIVMSLMIIVLIYQAVLIMNNQYTCKESIISLYICGSVLICSVQCVRNGYD